MSDSIQCARNPAVIVQVGIFRTGTRPNGRKNPLGGASALKTGLLWIHGDFPRNDGAGETLVISLAACHAGNLERNHDGLLS